MKIGIAGLGVVGTANKKGFEHIGHIVYSHDIKLETKIEDLLDTEISFVCVPTPSNETGECDTTIVESVILELSNLNYKGIVAIRSTAVPGFTQSMIEKYKNLTICYIPEFLRERCATDDFINNQKLLAVGSYDKWVYEKVITAHGNIPENVVHLTPTEAEVLKYFNNVYASLRVTFANVMYEICEKLNCDYTAIKNSYIKTGKATDMYLDVSEGLRGYGGMCLPKDTKALAKLIEKLNLELDLISSIDHDNSKFKTTVFNGMRP